MYCYLKWEKEAVSGKELYRTEAVARCYRTHVAIKENEVTATFLIYTGSFTCTNELKNFFFIRIKGV